MKISLDFDGVVADTVALKVEVAKIMYDKNLPSSYFEKIPKFSDDTLTEKQYRDLQRIIYQDPAVGMRIKPIPNSLAVTRDLILEGHDLQISTARKDVGVDIAYAWMEQQKYPTLQIVGFEDGETSKVKACQQVDMHLDDSPNELEALVKTVPDLILLHGDHNKDYDTKPSHIVRVDCWKTFYHFVDILDSYRRAKLND